MPKYLLKINEGFFAALSNKDLFEANAKKLTNQLKKKKHQMQKLVKNKPSDELSKEVYGKRN